MWNDLLCALLKSSWARELVNGIGLHNEWRNSEFLYATKALLFIILAIFSAVRYSHVYIRIPKYNHLS